MLPKKKCPHLYESISDYFPHSSDHPFILGSLETLLTTDTTYQVLWYVERESKNNLQGK